MGPEATVQLCMRHVGKRIPKPATDAPAVCQFVRGLGHEDRESFLVLHLNVKNQVIDVDRVAKGTVANVEVEPREVFKAAILNNAKSLVLVHNHPSGDVAPSQQDLDLTARLWKAGELIGIPVHDHVIVAHNQCVSLAARGLLHKGQK